ncbi:MAG: response regulator [Bacteroidales bacterium]|jgi:two-component system response regulator YesN|nr:response regulator [Bacteroidales bacterium]
MKVMIVDDEYLVRIGLRTMVDWEQLGHNVVAEAQNSKEALALFDKADPDILITDIKMGNSNGLNLAKELKFRKPSLKIIVITHLEDFHYIKEAFKLGIDEYILKSELSPSSILISLDNLKIEKSRHSNTISATEKRHELDRLLAEGLEYNYDYNEQNKTLFMSNWSPRLTWLVFEFFYTDDSISLCNFQNARNDTAFRGFLEDTFRSQGAEFAWFSRENQLHILLCRHDAKICPVNIIRTLRANFQRFIDAESNVGVSAVCEQVDVPKAIHDQAMAALEVAFFKPDHICYYSEDEFKSRPMALPIPSFSEIDRHIRTRNQAGLDTYWNQIIDKVAKTCSFDTLRQVYNDLIGIARIIIERESLSKSSASSLAKLNYDTFHHISNISNARQYILDLFKTITDNRKLRHQYSDTIQKSLVYIQNHYTENISLGDVATSVQKSKNYISLLFKQELGVNFVNYLTNLRIEYAKELLTTTDLLIYEIADKSGFDNQYYFSTVFKDSTGLTCKEFKKKSKL